MKNLKNNKGKSGEFSKGAGPRGKDSGKPAYKKTSWGGAKTSPHKTMFSANCNSCHQNCQVPFKPTIGKQVYCRNCFEDRAPEGESRDSRSSAPSRPAFKESSKQFDELNAKLDAILWALEKLTNKKG